MELLSRLLDPISHLYLPGAVALWCSLVLGLAALWGYVSALGGDGQGIAFGRRSYRFYTLALTLTCLVFALSLVRRDFRIEYVFQYTGVELPFHYQFAAFWAGQKGSFLIWLLWASLLGLLLMRTCGKKLEAPVMTVYLLTVFGLLLILVRENPFVMLTETPADGKGLNPLLQDDWMVIHPPIMFIGYALSAMPFAFAIAAMWRQDYREWATRAFPWALAGFLVLGTAILMGGYWAYKTLGWGGYWGWDPVENASLIPWLLGTALIHGLYLEKSKGRYRRANLVLACLGYLSVLYGTFLTRSGVLADFSVHSFVDLGISGLLILQMAFFAVLSLGLLALRLGKVPTVPNADPAVSRGSFLVLGSIALLTSATVVAVGTSAPLLTRFLPNPGQVGPEFYNKVNTPIALLIACLLAMVPVVTWREEPGSSLFRQLRWAGLSGLAVTLLAAIVAVRHPLHLALVFLATAALTSNLLKVVQLARSESLKRAGGYLTHVGVGIMLLGFLASSAYDDSVKITLQQGVPQQVDDLELTFTQPLARTAKLRERMEIRVVHADGKTNYAYPQLFVNDRTRQLMVHPDVHSFLAEDLYISPIEFDPGRPASEWVVAELPRGESTTLGDATVRFVDLDVDRAHVDLASLDEGTMVTVGAVLEVSRGGSSEQVIPLYRFNQQGEVDTPPQLMPGGGRVALTGINPNEGSVRLVFAGMGVSDPGAAPQLSIDVTRKPLIQLVWGGLYVVLLGGILAASQRLRQLRRLDEAMARQDGEPEAPAAGSGS